MINDQLEKIIKQGSALIQAGKLVAFPTETVYGLGANALNHEACEHIYQIKGRPKINPLIIHVGSLEEAQEIASFNEEALILAKQFSPGPLTFVLPKRTKLKLYNSSSLSTVAIRIPAHPVALKLIKEAGTPIAAPSANKSGMVSPTQAWHVEKQFGNEVFIIPDIFCGTKYGLESTIIDCSSKVPCILRHGFITQELIEDTLGTKILGNYDEATSVLKSPGLMLKHYSPDVNLRINAVKAFPGEIVLDFGNSNLAAKEDTFSINLSDSGNLLEAAKNLFDSLYRLDEYAHKHNIQNLAVAQIPLNGIGAAINDKLKRASHKT